MKDEEEEKVLTVEGKERGRWRRIGGQRGDGMVMLLQYSNIRIG